LVRFCKTLTRCGFLGICAAVAKVSKGDLEGILAIKNSSPVVAPGTLCPAPKKRLCEEGDLEQRGFLRVEMSVGVIPQRMRRCSNDFRRREMLLALIAMTRSSGADQTSTTSVLRLGDTRQTESPGCVMISLL
jgi:hypothetical protein